MNQFLLGWCSALECVALVNGYRLASVVGAIAVLSGLYVVAQRQAQEE